jgi:hypothetical protein
MDHAVRSHCFQPSSALALGWARGGSWRDTEETSQKPETPLSRPIRASRNPVVVCAEATIAAGRV